MPPIVAGRPADTFVPSAGSVINELTTISVIGVLVALSCDVKRVTSGNFPSGMR